MKSTLLILVNAALISGIFAGWSRPQLPTWIPVMMLFAANVWLTGARPSDYLLCGRDPRRPIRTLWYVWWIFMGIYLMRQFLENLDLQKEVGYANPTLVAVDISWKNLVFILSIANTMVWNRRQTMRDRLATLVIALGAYAFGNMLWGAIKPLQGDGIEEFGESRFEGKDARWLPPLARSNASFAYVCASTFAAGAAWGVSRLLRRDVRPRNWIIAGTVAVAAVMAAMAAYRAEFRSNAVGVAAALGIAIIPFHRLRAAAMGFLLTAMIGFPMLFFGPMGYVVLESLSPERLTSATGARGQEDATLTYRTFLWEYAAKRLQDHEVFLIGEGPANRDAQPGYGWFYEGYRMSFHSASIEFLMANGVPLALVGFWCLARMLHLAFGVAGRARSPALQIEMLEPWIFFCASCFVISIVDPGVATPEGFALVMLPGFGLLVSESLHSAPAASRPSLATATPMRPGLATARELGTT
jgi:hypothetical protein